jgi:hypothetical protein
MEDFLLSTATPFWVAIKRSTGASIDAGTGTNYENL